MEVLLLDRLSYMAFPISNNGCSGGNFGSKSVIASSEVVLCCSSVVLYCTVIEIVAIVLYCSTIGLLYCSSSHSNSSSSSGSSGSSGGTVL